MAQFSLYEPTSFSVRVSVCVTTGNNDTCEKSNTLAYSATTRNYWTFYLTTLVIYNYSKTTLFIVSIINLKM